MSACEADPPVERTKLSIRAFLIHLSARGGPRLLRAWDDPEGEARVSAVVIARSLIRSYTVGFESNGELGEFDLR